MTNLPAHLTALFQHNPELGMALLVATLVLIALVVQRKLYRKHIDSNGKIERTPRFSFRIPTLPAFRSVSASTSKRKKPYSAWQRKVMRLVYAAQEAFFGLIVFGFGLVMFIAVMMDIGDTPRKLFQLLPAARCIVSILTMITGILLVYFRNVDNPFDDS